MSSTPDNTPPDDDREHPHPMGLDEEQTSHNSDGSAKSGKPIVPNQPPAAPPRAQDLFSSNSRTPNDTSPEASEGAPPPRPSHPRSPNRTPKRSNASSPRSNDTSNKSRKSTSPTHQPRETNRRWSSSPRTRPQRSAAQSVQQGTPADKRSNRAARIGSAASRATKGTRGEQRLASDLGRDISDMRNAPGVKNKARAARNAAEKAARMVASKKTGGLSEKALNSKPGKVAISVLRAAAAASVLVPLSILGLIVIAAVVVIAAVTGTESMEGDYEYTLTKRDPMYVDKTYIDAYKDAGANHDIPWPILAGIGQVATEHGRYAPSDIADFGQLVDRAPHLAPIGSAPGATIPTKSSPPPGSDIVIVGDSFVDGGRAPLEEALDMYSLSFSNSSGATIADIRRQATGAAAQRAAAVVVQAGVNDIYQSVEPDIYREQMRTIMDAVQEGGCLVWANVQLFYSGEYESLGPAAQTFNAILAEEAATRSWVSIADIATTTAVAGMQAPDGLHLSPLGYETWAAQVAQQVVSCAPAPPPQQSSGEQEVVLTASGQPVLTDARYGTYLCDGSVCGPIPRMGEAEGTPLGPFQLDREWVKDNANGRSPDDVVEAADMLAEEIARLRDEAVKGPAADMFTGWRSDPQAATELWSYVVAQAPVIFPTRARSTSCSTGPIAGPQGSPYVWPVLEPVAYSEFGAAVENAEQVQVAGMVVGGASSEVLAAGSGTVSDIGRDVDGRFIVIVHGDGLSTRYGYLSEVLVSVGDSVEAESIIASFNDRMYFETRVGPSPRNPRLYLADAAEVPLAETVAIDPQGGSTDDPQAGVPVDPCTGLRIVSTVSSSTSPSAAPTPTALVIPVAGVAASELRDSFGAPRSGGRSHQGIDIVVPIGTPLVAVVDATVKSSTAGGVPCPTTGDPGRGVSLLDSAGNSYYYGHMDTVSVEKGQTVRAGQYIGTVGQSGNACVSVPHLHFSINENTDKVVNPYPILSGARSLSVTDYASTIGGSALAALQSSATISGAAGYVIGFASFYGGIVPNDPNAGRFPGTSGAYSSSASEATGLSGEELASRAPEIASIIRLYFPPEQWDNALRVAQCESGLKPTAVSPANSNGTRDYGLFQFNDGGTLQGWLTTTGEDPSNIHKALDPHWSARAAAMKVQRDGNWGQWSCAHTPYGSRTYGLSIVSVSPETIRTGRIDYNWQESGPGDTSVRYG